MLYPRAIAGVSACLLLLLAMPASAATFATFDAAQFDTNGFAFADFNDFFAIDTTGGTIDIDIMNDLDGVNGLFGGMGSDLVADFDPNTTNLEVALTVDPLNVASSFNIVLVDNDGSTSGEEYQFSFDLTGVTPGVPTLLTQSLVSPGPVFSQPAFGQDPGDGIQNYGLRQVQIQSVFGSPDRLKISVDSVSLIDPDDPLLIELTPSTFDAQVASFTFETFSDPGVVTDTGDTFVINADASTPSGPGGGLGFSGLNVDFEAADHSIEVEAKLLPGNTAAGFNVLLGDVDGDDSAPMMGSEDFLFTFDTADFNTSDFTTVSIPIGSGTESLIETTFGFLNGGDGLQNFGLSQLQLQALGEGDLGVLGLEVRRVSVVENLGVAGDFDGDGDVDLADAVLGQRNGEDLTSGGDWNGNFGQGESAATAASAVPEPSAAFLGLLSIVAAACRCRQGKL